MRPRSNTKIGFGEIFTSAQQFYNECAAADIPLVLSEARCKQLFYLLYAKYGNNAIANYDETQWKYRIFTTIFTYGGEWSKKLDIQGKLQDLNLESGDLFETAKAIYNQAANPSVAPSTGSTEELGYVNQQTVSKYKKGKVDAYGLLWGMLNSDVTVEFVRRFENCFPKFSGVTIGPVYISDTDEFEEE